MWKEQTDHLTEEKHHLHTEKCIAAVFTQTILDVHPVPDQVSSKLLTFPNKNPYNSKQSSPLLPSTQLNSTQFNSTQLNSTQLNSTQLNSTQLKA